MPAVLVVSPQKVARVGDGGNTQLLVSFTDCSSEGGGGERCVNDRVNNNCVCMCVSNRGSEGGVKVRERRGEREREEREGKRERKGREREKRQREENGESIHSPCVSLLVECGSEGVTDNGTR